MNTAPPPPPTAAEKPASATLRSHLTLETPLGAVLDARHIRLLEAVEADGSLNRAARRVPLSYKAAWAALDALDRLAPEPLVMRSTGGVGGGGTRLTDYGRRLVALYRAMESAQQAVLDRLPDGPPQGDTPALRTLLRRLTVQSSARNQFPARVCGLQDRGGLVDVELALAGGDRVQATVTPESVAEMALAPGSEVHALVKAPWVTLTAQPPAPREGLNHMAGTLQALRPGAAHTGGDLRLPDGQRVTGRADPSALARLRPGEPAWAHFDSESVVLLTFG